MSGSDHVNPASPGLKLTYDDFLLFPEDGQRHELIDGEHHVTPAPTVRHQTIVGTAWGAPVDVVLSSSDVVANPETDVIRLPLSRIFHE